MPDRPRKKMKYDPGTKICFGELEVFRLKGKGTFGKVISCKETKRNASPIALKVFNEPSNGLRERDLLTQLEDCFGVVQYRSDLDFELSDGEYSFAMEELSHDLRLERRRHPLGLRRIRRIGKQLVRALGEIHARNIVHGDLKPANILISKDGHTIKLCDFGASWKINSPPDGQRVGTISIRSPDVIIGWNFGPAIDMWSLGCVLFMTYTGYRPFYVDPQCPPQGENLAMLRSIIFSLGPISTPDIRSGSRFDDYFQPNGNFKIDVPVPVQITPIRRILKMMGFPKCNRRTMNFLDLLAGLWRYDPEERLTPSRCMAHSFFKMK